MLEFHKITHLLPLHLTIIISHLVTNIHSVAITNLVPVTHLATDIAYLVTIT